MISAPRYDLLLPIGYLSCKLKAHQRVPCVRQTISPALVEMVLRPPNLTVEISLSLCAHELFTTDLYQSIRFASNRPTPDSDPYRI